MIARKRYSQTRDSQGLSVNKKNGKRGGEWDARGILREIPMLIHQSSLHYEEKGTGVLKLHDVMD